MRHFKMATLTWQTFICLCRKMKKESWSTSFRSLRRRISRATQRTRSFVGHWDSRYCSWRMREMNWSVRFNFQATLQHWLDAAYCYRWVALSVSLSVMTTSPAKMTEPIEMLFALRTWVGPKNSKGSRSPWNGHFWGVTLGFSHVPPSTVSSDPDIGISPHAADQISDWPATEEVECHIKFSQWKIPLWCGLLSKFFDHLLKI